MFRLSLHTQGEQNPKFMDRLVNFDVNSLGMVPLAQLNRLLTEPEFNIVQVCVCVCVSVVCVCAICVLQ